MGPPPAPEAGRRRGAGGERPAAGVAVDRCGRREQRQRAVAALAFKTEVLWAQLDAIERGDTQPEAAA